MYFGQRFHTPNETSKECIQFLNQLLVYSEHKCWSKRGSVYTGNNVLNYLYP